MPDSDITKVQVGWFDLDALPARCLRALAAAELHNPELSLEWFRNLAEHALDEGFRGVVLEAHSEAAAGATALLPFQVGKRPGELRALANFYSSLYAPVVSGMEMRDGLNALFQAIVDEGWHSLWLAPMALEQPIFGETLGSLRETGWLAFPFYCFGNWYLPVEGRSYAEYFQRLPSQVRNTVQRRGQTFHKAGLGRIELVTGGDDLEEAIDCWERIYNASWKVPEPYLEFMPGLIRLCAEKGWLRMGLAYYGDVAIAAQVWIVSNGRAAIYKLAYDKAYAKHSAGTLLTDFLMRHVLDEDRVSEVDYLIGDDAYKKDWMSHRRERWGIVAYNPRHLRGLLGGAREMLGRWVKSTFSRKALPGGSRQNREGRSCLV